MTAPWPIAAQLDPHSEGWLWWFVLVLGLVVVLIVLHRLRRRWVAPLPRRPTDTTDAWAEAGRRLRLPPDVKSGKPPADEGETP